MSSAFENDLRIDELAPAAIEGDETALDELAGIYYSGVFDPGFGGSLEALLGKHGKLCTSS